MVPLPDPVRVECLLFDLDDTLFEQMDYLQGAFGAAAAASGIGDPGQFVATMSMVSREMGSASGKIFDETAKRLGMTLEPAVVKAMVRGFRAHRPESLEPYPGTVPILSRLARQWPLGIVTDGPVETQVAKLGALPFNGLFTTVILSDSIAGVASRKPSPVPYRAALDAIGARAERTIYIGDNPRKDFIGARQLGMGTARVLTGEYRQLDAHPGYEADVTIENLKGLAALLFSPDEAHALLSGL